VEQEYRLVMNGEEQYAVWPVADELPEGWVWAGETAAGSDSAAALAPLWTDMRPASLREAMAANVIQRG
jgi:MbtH protein